MLCPKRTGINTGISWVSQAGPVFYFPTRLCLWVSEEMMRFFAEYYTQIPRGRVAWNIDKFIVFVGKWAEDIQHELTELINQHFALPDFEFVYDYHWDLGHGLSGDL